VVDGVENNEPFARVVSLGVKARLKELKKQVLCQLSMESMCDLRIYFYSSQEAPAGTEEKEIEAAKEDVACEKGE
jgi:hypothetical protein